MTRKYFPALLIITLFVAGVTLYYFFDTKRTQTLLDQINNEYPVIDLASRMESRILYIVHPHSDVFRNSPHHAFVIFSNNLKRRIIASNELSTDTLSLDDILAVGDLLIKEPNSDTLSILRIRSADTLKYTFVLHNEFGYPLKK